MIKVLPTELYSRTQKVTDPMPDIADGSWVQRLVGQSLDIR